MSAKIYVGNLSWNTTDETLSTAFAEFGQVLEANVMRDRDTGRSRGFAFVTFSSEDEANGAVAGMNEQELDGRRVRVNIANARGSGGGGGGGGSGYGQQRSYGNSGGYGNYGAGDSYGQGGY
ncbi:putative heterogeneous nuclear ribonucleoprotein G [Lactarius hengduanensis]|nr:putative heterogeneous nuclear ribonucleoprotein G [Lactarius hengduanensis]